MSLRTAIDDLKSRISGLYDVLENKGATIPEIKDTYNLSATIESIPQGGTDGVTIQQVNANDANNQYAFIDNDCLSIQPTLFAFMRYTSTANENFGLSSVECRNAEYLGYRAFYECNNLKSVILPKVNKGIATTLTSTTWMTNNFNYAEKLEHIEMPLVSALTLPSELSLTYCDMRNIKGNVTTWFYNNERIARDPEYIDLRSLSGNLDYRTRLFMYEGSDKYENTTLKYLNLSSVSDNINTRNTSTSREYDRYFKNLQKLIIGGKSVHHFYNGNIDRVLVTEGCISAVSFLVYGTVREIDLPSTLEYAPDFYYHYKATSPGAVIEKICCRAINPPQSSYYSLMKNTKVIDLYVPAQSIEAYKTDAKWGICFENIHPLEDLPDNWDNWEYEPEN